MVLELLIMLNEYEDTAPFRIEWDSSAIRTLLQLDRTTLQHSLRTYKLAVILGKKLRLSSTELILLGQGALFHDIGKTKIPLTILNKQNPLTSEEWAILQTHPQRGKECLEPFAMDETIQRIVLRHHVWFNGEGGYPLDKDKAKPCPLTQIVMVADVIDAMTSDRSYRRAHTIADTQQYMEARAGSWFNSEVVAVFGSLVSKFQKEESYR